MPKPMTPSEQLVGRRLPNDAKYLDQLMAQFVKNPDADDDENRFCGKMTPSDSWFRSPHRQARKNGWIRSGIRIGFGKGRPVDVWYLTETGKVAALEAKQRVATSRQARKEWAEDFHAAHRAARAERSGGGDDAPTP